MFGLDHRILENDLSRIFRPLNEFLCLIDMSFKGQYKEENNLDFLLRLLVRMTEIFSTKYGPALESGTLIRCPYFYKADTFNIEVCKNIFVIRAKNSFEVPGYSMTHFAFELIMLLNETIFYQKNLAGRIDSTLEIRGTTNYILTNFYIQNFTDASIKINQGDIIGRIYVGSDDNLILNPINQRREDLIRLIEAANESKLNHDNYTTVTALSNMLEAAQLSYKNGTSKLWDRNEKKAKIASLVCQIKGKAKDRIDLDDRIKKVNFDKLRGQLNIILLSQYLLSNGHQISQGDLAQIQNTDREVNSLKKSTEAGNENYLIKNNILYKKAPFWAR